MTEVTTALPTRMLGATGCQVSVLALGGVRYNERDDAHAAAVVNRALDLFLRYVEVGQPSDEVYGRE